MKNHLRELLTRAIEKATKGGELAAADLPPSFLEPPKQKEFGDLASNVAMIWAKAERKSPRAIAEAILRNLDDPEGILAKSEIAGPGFINFTFSPRFCYALLEAVDAAREREIDLGGGARVQVEFASANPTGPLHVGHGRVAVIGDVLARLLQAAGFAVEREYYVNDAGRQMEQLGLSVYLRYRELYGEKIELPEDAYPGDYVKEVAALAKERWGERFLKEKREEAVRFLSDFGGGTLLDGIRGDLAGFGIAFDSFVSERALREQGEVVRTIELLRARGVLYQEEGAEWFRSTAYGDDKDRTVVKSDGELTYFASDIAYHRHKFERGFARLINVWGADHHGYVNRVKAAAKALGYDPEILRVVLVQKVRLTRGGEVVQMGKRLGEYVGLQDLLDEVGKDAARFFFLMRKSDSHLDFDLELAKKESSENPVFYVQYAHARISSLFEQARQSGIDVDGVPAGRAKLERLAEPEELELIKRVLGFPEIIEESVKELEPHRLAFYLLELAGEFHRYYNRFRVISDDRELAVARLVLLRNVQKVIRRGLDLLGVEAPVRMVAREESATGVPKT